MSMFEEALDIRPLSSGRDPQTGTVHYASWLLVSTQDGPQWKPYVLDQQGEIIEQPVWMPLPGSQMLFLQCPVFEALYHGTRGPGKSLSLIMDFASEVGKGYGSSWRGILFRRQFGDLDDIVKKIEEWFPVMFPGFRFLKSKSEYMAQWTTGEALLLRHMRGIEDYDEYHGHEYPWIGFEELTQWEDEQPLNAMMSCCRSAKPGIPNRVRATTNPYGAGHTWVRKRYRLPDQNGKVVREPGQMPRVAIYGSIHENFLLLQQQPNYPTQIRQAARNPAQADAWLKGDWTVTSGGMIDDLWSPRHHVLPPIPPTSIPRGWTITRAYDHGQSHPFAVGWWLESNGEPIRIENRLIGNVRGDLILWQEWYGTTGSPNEGIRMPARKIGQGIRDREEDLGVWGKVQPGPADTEIFNQSSDRDGRSPADDMESAGIFFERANKAPGTRKRGWEMLRTRLENAIPNLDGSREQPGLFVCSNCRHFIEIVPPMPRDEKKDPDDVPKSYEDHIADMVRYRLNWEPPGMWRRSGF